MKHFYLIFLLSLLLPACQTVTTTPVSPVNTLIAATSTSEKAVSKSTGTPTAAPTPTGPVVHDSSSDPNASNLIAVSDQFIINNSLTIDTVSIAQAGFIVLYYDKPSQGTHELGKLIVFAPVPTGKSSHLVIPLTQNLNPTVNIAGLPGNPVDAVLQTNASNPHSMVQENGKNVMVTFNLLAKAAPSFFATATP